MVSSSATPLLVDKTNGEIRRHLSIGPARERLPDRQAAAALTFCPESPLCWRMDEPGIEIDIAALFESEPGHGERFSIYVPNKDRNGALLSQEPWVEEALALLSKIGGGATAMPPVEGAWLNEETAELIREQPRVVYSYIIPDRFLEHRDELVGFVKRMGRETNQGAIAIEFDGVLYYVDKFSEQE